MTLLEEIRAQLGALPDGDPKLNEIAAHVNREMGSKKFVPNEGPQTEAYLSRADLLLYGGEGGGGKQMHDDTPVPVPLETDPSGFKRHGDLRPGDEVFSPSGNAIKVIAVSERDPEPDAYDIEMDTGEVFTADGNHLWETWTQRERDKLLRRSEEWRARRRAERPSRAVAVSKKPWVSRTLTQSNRERVYEVKMPRGAVRSTRAIGLSLRDGKDTNHSIRVCQAIDGIDRALPIEPYLFGLWIGDGYSAQPSIGMTESDWPEIMGWLPRPDSTKVDIRPPRIRPFIVHRFSFMLPLLRGLGVLHGKRLPPLYLRASRQQRIALLQGILDTDGTCDKRGQIEVGFSNQALAGDLHELVSSLGIKSTLRSKQGRDQNGRGRIHWRIKFVCPFQAFRLSRKGRRQKLAHFRPTVLRRYIQEVRKAKPVSMRCIQVSAEDGLYLVGRSFVPTHNSALGVGLGFNEHRRSLVLRRRFADLEALTDIAISFNGGRDGFTSGGRPKMVTPDNRVIIFGANQYAGDEQGWQGNPFDFKYIDEGCQLLEQQVRFHLGWIRLGPGVPQTQRCRAIIGSNPPLDANGDWIIGMFRPWLDLTHPRPAKNGELRWFITDEKGDDFEVDGPDPIERFGHTYIPQSRSFIRARLSDNPYLSSDNKYKAQLDAMPEPLRSAIRDGNFMAARPDADRQVIPMSWIIAAQDRWNANGHKDFAMTALAIDPAGGGADACEISYRHGGWYAPPVTTKGEQTADGAAMAGIIVAHRRDACPVVVDVGGGYGGAVMLRLKDNGIDSVRFDGGGAATSQTRDGSKLKFVNKRAEAWWRFREELNPEQQGGSVICLPPDPELRADLAAPTWELRPNGILVESKDELRKRLGRSPGKGDAAVYCLDSGNAAVRRTLGRSGGSAPVVLHGYAHMKRHRHG